MPYPLKFFTHIALLGFCLVANCALATNWPQFRGPAGLSNAGDQDIPVEFGPEKNLAWRIDIPRGNASPIIWGDYLFLAAYENQDRVMMAIDRRNGSLLWKKTVPAQEPEAFTHRLSGPAESTPCTDGERVYFYFGNYGLVALNFDGLPAWEIKLSRPKSSMGSGSSPILYEDLLILNRDGTKDPCILALDTQSGEVRWKHPRLGYKASHASPFIWRNRLRTELIIAGTSSLVSLNPETGRLIWKVEDTNGFPCTTPTGNADTLLFAAWSAAGVGGRKNLEAHFDDDLTFSDEELADPALFFKRFDVNSDGVIIREEMPDSRARDVFPWLDRDKDGIWEPDEFGILLKPAGDGRNIMVAISVGGEGLLNDTGFLAWDWRKDLPYVASPVVSKNRVYLIKSLGIISCLNTETGEPFYSGKRTGLKGEYFTSPVLAGDKIFFASSLGTVFVMLDGENFEILAENQIGEEIIATPAVVDDTVYLRSRDSLWAFSNRIPNAQ